MRSGTLKWFDEGKGYGFIAPADGGEPAPSDDDGKEVDAPKQ